MLAILCLVPRAFAHSPFDCSARVILHADSAEVTVTVGTTLGANLLQTTPVSPRSLNTLGTPKSLPPELAVKLMDVRVDGQRLTASGTDVSTDGLEYRFRMVYPLARAATLQLHPLFLRSLQPPQQTALVVTDENGNGLGSAVLSPARELFQVALPGSMFPSSAIAGVKPAVAGDSNVTPAIAVTPPVAPPMNPQRPGFQAYWQLGWWHILTGYDHLLFLGGLLVVCQRVGPMLILITCFTLAHSLTLALAALDLVQISSRIIEPLIAATIIGIGIENFRGRVDVKTRCGLAVGFGLIHGFGFAGALRETGLAVTGHDLAVPLLAFNLGVECGQLVVAALVLPLLFLLRRLASFQAWGTQAVSAVVVALGGFWLAKRVFGFES